MKFVYAAIALAAVCANAQSTSTVLAPCGTDCPTTVPDKMITRSMPAPTESTPCPSLIVSSASGGSGGSPGNGSAPTGTGIPTPTSFTGGAMHTAGPVGLVIAAVGAVAALAL